MARPRSETKRSLLLDAAARVVAERGEGAPTALVAKLAGVAEGSLFTYFPTKETLLDELHASLLDELRAAACGPGERGSRRARLEHAWRRSLAWRLANPEKNLALRVLQASPRVTERKRASSAARAKFLVEQLGSDDDPPGFTQAALEAISELTLDLIAERPQLADAYGAAGLAACWKIVGGR